MQELSSIIILYQRSFYRTNFLFFAVEWHGLIMTIFASGHLSSSFWLGDFGWTFFSHWLAVLGVPSTTGLPGVAVGFGVAVGVEMSGDRDSCETEIVTNWCKETITNHKYYNYTRETVIWQRIAEYPEVKTNQSRVERCNAAWNIRGCLNTSSKFNLSTLSSLQSPTY